VLRAVLNAAVDADLIAPSPVRGVRVSNGAPRVRPSLSLDEVARPGRASPSRYQVLILTAGVLGLRWSEAVGLRIATSTSCAGH
jgi:hypothetical protein